MFQSNLDYFAQGAFAALGDKKKAGSTGVGDLRLAIQDLSNRADDLREGENAINPDTFGSWVGAVNQYNRDARLLGVPVPPELSMDAVRERWGEYLPGETPAAESPPAGESAAATDPAAQDGTAGQGAPAGAGQRMADPLFPEGPFGSDRARVDYMELRTAAIQAAADYGEAVAEVEANQADKFMMEQIEETAKRLGVSKLAVWSSPATFEPMLQSLLADLAARGTTDQTLEGIATRLRLTQEKITAGMDADTAQAESEREYRRQLSKDAYMWVASAVAGRLGMDADALDMDFFATDEDKKTFRTLTFRAAELVAQGAELHEIIYDVTQEFAGVTITGEDGVTREIFPVHKPEDMNNVMGSALFNELQREAWPYLPKDGKYKLDPASGEFWYIPVGATDEAGRQVVRVLEDDDLRQIIAMGKARENRGSAAKAKAPPRKDSVTPRLDAYEDFQAGLVDSLTAEGDRQANRSYGPESAGAQAFALHSRGPVPAGHGQNINPEVWARAGRAYSPPGYAESLFGGRRRR